MRRRWIQVHYEALEGVEMGSPLKVRCCGLLVWLSLIGVVFINPECDRLVVKCAAASGFVRNIENIIVSNFPREAEGPFTIGNLGERFFVQPLSESLKIDSLPIRSPNNHRAKYRGVPLWNARFLQLNPWNLQLKVKVDILCASSPKVFEMQNNRTIPAYWFSRGKANTIKKNICALRKPQGQLGSVGALGSGVGSLFGSVQALTHDSGLTPMDEDLDNRSKRNNPSEHDNPPIGRRWFLAVISSVGGLFGGSYGFNLIDSGRKWLGRFLVGTSILAFAAADTLFFLTIFRWSWGWPL